MSSFLDTNVVIRYLINVPLPQAEEATRIIERDEDLFITDVAIAEVGYVLTSTYRLPRDEAVQAIIAFLARQNVQPFGLDKALVIHGLEMCRPSSRVSFGDALIWAAARSARAEAVYTFDERFPKDGIAVRRGAP